MKELDDLRDELDRTWDYQLMAENAVLAQRRRTRELDEALGEERRSNGALPNHLKGA